MGYIIDKKRHFDLENAAFLLFLFVIMHICINFAAVNIDKSYL